MSADEIIENSVKGNKRSNKNVNILNQNNDSYSFVGNLIGAATTFFIDAAILSVKLVIYYIVDEEKRQEYINKGYAIDPENYVKAIIESGGACLAGGGLAALAVLGAGTFFSVTGGTALTAASILFGLIGYFVGRALIKTISGQVRNFL